MMHRAIRIKDLCLSFPHKICFEDFTTQVQYGSRIAIIGCNGSGKSTLLKMLQGAFDATEGEIRFPEEIRVGYVPQIIGTADTLSGGQRLNKAITEALSVEPNVLLLDEPMNHLDRHNRIALMRKLAAYKGTLIVATRDTELLRNNIHTLGHIDHGKIHIFSGSYDDYMQERHIKCTFIEKEIAQLRRQKRDMHQHLMKEQQRAAKSRAKGEKSIDQRKWPTIVNKTSVGAKHQGVKKQPLIIKNKY